MLLLCVSFSQYKVLLSHTSPACVDKMHPLANLTCCHYINRACGSCINIVNAAARVLEMNKN